MRWMGAVGFAVSVTLIGAVLAYSGERVTLNDVDANATPALLRLAERKSQQQTAPNTANRDGARLFGLFDTIFERVRKDYVDPPNDRELLLGAVEGMREAFPGSPDRGADRIDLNYVHSVGSNILSA